MTRSRKTKQQLKGSKQANSNGAQESFLSPFTDPRFLAKSLSHSELASHLKKICLSISEVEPETVHSSSVQNDLKKLINMCSKQYLFDHRSSEVRNLTACLLVDLIRLSDNPFEDSISQLPKSLEFLIEILEDIHDTAHSEYPLKFHVLEILNKKSAFLLIFEVQSTSRQHSILIKLFNQFLTILEKDVINAVREYLIEILAEIIQEPNSSICDRLVEVILERLTPEFKVSRPLAYNSSINLINMCDSIIGSRIIDNLHTLLGSFSSTNIFAHVVCELAAIIPSTVTCIIPKLQDLLETDNSSDRLNFTKMFGSILSIENSKIPADYLLNAFNRRFVDSCFKIRIEVLRMTKPIMLAHPQFSNEICSLSEARCTDTDESVRKEAVLTMCDILSSFPNLLSTSAVDAISHRMRDKHPSVRRLAIDQGAHLFLKIFDSHKTYAYQVASQVIELFQYRDIFELSKFAESAFDEIILGSNRSVDERAIVLTCIYGSLTDDMKKLLVSHLIEEKSQLQRMVLQVYRNIDDGEDIYSSESQNQILQKIWRKAGLHLECAKVVFSDLQKIFSLPNRKVRQWVENICRNSSDADVCRSSGQEIVRSLRSISQSAHFNTMVEVLICLLSSAVLNDDIFRSLLKIPIISKDDLASLAMDLATEFSACYPNTANDSISDLISLLRLNDLRSQTLKILSTCSLQKQSRQLSLLVEQLLNFCSGDFPELSAIAIKVLYNISPEAQALGAEFVSKWTQKLSSEMENMETIFNSFAEIAFRTTDIESFSLINEFILKEILSDHFFLASKNVSCIDAASTASAISVLTNQVVSQNPEDAFALARDTLRVIVRVLSEFPSPTSKEIPLVSQAISDFLRIMCVKKYQVLISGEDLLCLSHFAVCSKDQLCELLFERLWEHSKKLALPSQLFSILSLFTLPSNHRFSDKAKHRLLFLVAAQRKRNMLLTRMKKDDPHFQLPIRLFPEYNICFVIFLLAHHIDFDDSSRFNHSVGTCLKSFLQSLLQGENSHNFSMIFAVLQSVRLSRDKTDPAYSQKLYTIEESCRSELSKIYQGKEWKQTFSREVVLPSNLFEKSDYASLDVPVEPSSVEPHVLALQENNSITSSQLSSISDIADSKKGRSSKRSNNNAIAHLDSSQTSIDEYITSRRSKRLKNKENE